MSILSFFTEMFILKINLKLCIIYLLLGNIVLHGDCSDKKDKSKTRSPQVAPGVPIGKKSLILNTEFFRSRAEF